MRLSPARSFQPPRPARRAWWLNRARTATSTELDLGNGNGKAEALRERILALRDDIEVDATVSVRTGTLGILSVSAPGTPMGGQRD